MTVYLAGRVLETSETSGTGALTLDGVPGSADLHAQSVKTDGDVTLSSTSYTDIDTSMDLTLPASVGDTVSVGVGLLAKNDATAGGINVEVVESGNLVDDQDFGPGHWALPGSDYNAVGGFALYTVVAADINASGNAVFRLQGRLESAGSKGIFAGTDRAINFYATNLTAQRRLGYQTFSDGVGAGNETYYMARHHTLDEWEEGFGTVSTGGTLLRSAGNVFGSSTGVGSLVDFSSGTKDLFVFPGAGLARYPASGFHKRTAGDLTYNSTAWGDLSTAMDIVVSARAGDRLQIGAGLRWGVEAPSGFLDFEMVQSGNLAGGGADNGIMCLYGQSSTLVGSGGSLMYDVVSGDTSSGQLRCRVRIRVSSSSSKTVYASTVSPFDWYVINHGPEVITT